MPQFLVGLEGEPAVHVGPAEAEPAAAIQEAASATVGIAGGTGGRHRDAAKDARRKNKIETVLAAAKKLWPDNRQRPPTTAMALELVRQKKAQGCRRGSGWNSRVA